MVENEEAKGTPQAPFRPPDAVADAAPLNWVDTRAPQWARPYLRLSRADRPIGTWLLLIPCWWSLALAMLARPTAIGWQDLWIAAGCALGAFLMRGAGCTWNDITDRDIDAKVSRTRSRPLPSKQVTVRQALGWLVLQSLIAFAILLTFHPAAIALGILALLPVAIYPFAKRFTWWPQLFLGIAFNWGALLAWAAHAGRLDRPAIALYAAGICWTLFYDTIYAHQDREDDALIGVKSTARLFAERTHRWLTAFLMLAVGFMAIAAWSAARMGGAGPLPSMLALAGALAFGAHLLWQLRRLDIDNGAICLMLFRSNRDAGLLAALFFAAAALVHAFAN